MAHRVNKAALPLLQVRLRVRVLVALLQRDRSRNRVPRRGSNTLPTGPRTDTMSMTLNVRCSPVTRQLLAELTLQSKRGNSRNCSRAVKLLQLRKLGMGIEVAVSSRPSQGRGDDSVYIFLLYLQLVCIASGFSYV